MDSSSFFLVFQGFFVLLGCIFGGFALLFEAFLGNFKVSYFSNKSNLLFFLEYSFAVGPVYR